MNWWADSDKLYCGKTCYEEYCNCSRNCAHHPSKKGGNWPNACQGWLGEGLHLPKMGVYILDPATNQFAYWDYSHHYRLYTLNYYIDFIEWWVHWSCFSLRALRPGNPISPYIFMLCIKRLGHGINGVVQSGRWHPTCLSS